MPTQVLTNGDSRSCTFASRAHQLLRAARTYIASRENALGAGLEIHAGHNEALGIQFRDARKALTIWREADEDKDAWDLELFYCPRLRVFGDNGAQVIICTLELDHLSIETYLHLRRGQGLISGNLTCGEFRAAHQDSHFGTEA